jgi:gliding motility-associated-like protein
VPGTQTFYIDKHVNTGLYAYRYRIQAVNSCGVPIKTTVHRSIRLSGDFDQDTTIKLGWNPYEGWPVDEYKINTSQNADTTLTLYNFTRDTSFIVIKTLDGYRLCMRIAAYKAGSGLKNVISWSNKVCVDFDPILWIPNVFTPQNGDHLNNTYHVFASNYKTFQIDIYNRWGEHIFSSNDPRKQWDGTFKGDLCVEGVYLYILSVGGAKNTIYRHGTINLLR